MGSYDRSMQKPPAGPHVLVTTIAFLGLLLPVDGCTVGPKFIPPRVVVTENWRAHADPRLATQTATDGLWWKAFNDSTLERLVQLAYRQNLSLQIAALRIVEARARLGIATGRQYPQSQVAFGSASAVGLTGHLASLTRIDRNFVYYQLGFDAAWEIDFWGKYRRGVEAEAASVLASVGDYYSAIVSVAAEVARTYVAIRTYEVLIEQARENELLQATGLQIAESRLRNGATSELDVSQATTLLESTRASIPQLQIRLQQARNALSTLLGQPADTVEHLLGTGQGIPKAPDKMAVGLPAELLRRRPDIRSAELTAAAQCARIGIAKADLYPSFSLFGTIGLRASTIGNTSRNLFSTDSIFYAAGPQLNWPFFNYGRLKNGVRVEDARFQQLVVSYRDTVLRAVQEVEDALAGYLNAQQAVQFQQNAANAAQRSVELSLIEYREGATDYQRVLDAQRSLLQQQNDLAQTRSSVATYVVAVFKALGGGWEWSEGQQLVPEATQREMEDRTDWGDLLRSPSSPETSQKPPAAKH